MNNVEKLVEVYRFQIRALHIADTGVDRTLTAIQRYIRFNDWDPDGTLTDAIKTVIIALINQESYPSRAFSKVWGCTTNEAWAKMYILEGLGVVTMLQADQVEKGPLFEKVWVEYMMDHAGNPEARDAILIAYFDSEAQKLSTAQGAEFQQVYSTVENIFKQITREARYKAIGGFDRVADVVKMFNEIGEWRNEYLTAKWEISEGAVDAIKAWFIYKQFVEKPFPFTGSASSRGHLYSLIETDALFGGTISL